MKRVKRDRARSRQGRAYDRALGGVRERGERLFGWSKTRQWQKSHGEGHVDFAHVRRLAEHPCEGVDPWCFVEELALEIMAVEDERFETAELLASAARHLRREQAHEGEETTAQVDLIEALSVYAFRSDLGMTLPQRRSLRDSAEAWIERAKAEVTATMAAISKLEVALDREVA